MQRLIKTLIILITLNNPKITSGLICPKNSKNHMPMIVHYARLRRLTELVIFDEDLLCSHARINNILQTSIDENLKIALKTFSTPSDLKTFFRLQGNRLGVIVLFRSNETQLQRFIEQVSENELFTPYNSWLMIIQKTNYKNVLKILEQSSITIDSEFVIAVKRPNIIYATYNVTSHFDEQIIPIPRTQKRNKRLIAEENRDSEDKEKIHETDSHGDHDEDYDEDYHDPHSHHHDDEDLHHDHDPHGTGHDYDNVNHDYDPHHHQFVTEPTITDDSIQHTRNFVEFLTTPFISNISSTSRPYVTTDSRINPNFSSAKFNFWFFQIQKQQHSNGSLQMIVTELGKIEAITSPEYFHTLKTNVRDLDNFTLVIGVNNRFSVEAARQSIVDVPETNFDDIGILTDLIDDLVTLIGAEYEVKPFSRIGFKHHEGAWTDMLGALVAQQIDVILDFIVVDNDMLGDMYLTQPILETRRNLYYRNDQNNSMRDIFLYPFSIWLFCAVVVTTILIFMTIYTVRNSAAIKSQQDKLNEMNTSDAGIITIGIVCMQGTSWKPLDYSGRAVLICSLLFALLIYNSYQACITSVLSVVEDGRLSFNDLLKNQYKFGFTKGGMDEMYLKQSDDPQIRKIFIYSVYSDAIETPADGLSRVMTEKMAMFLPTHISRRLILLQTPPEGRCDIKELDLHETISPISLLMSKKSPYKDIVNAALIRLREVGILNKIGDLVKPGMPRCFTVQNFNSAQFQDVYTAFLMLGFCMVLSWVVFVGENVWYRREMYKKERLKNVATFVLGKPFKRVRVQ